MNHNLVLRRIRDSLPHHRPCCKKLFQDQYHHSRSKSYAKAATTRIRFSSTSSSSSSSISNSSSSSSTSSSSSSSLYSEEFWESPNIVDVSPLAESIRKKVRQYTSTYYSNNNNKRLRLVGILGPQNNNDDDDDDGQQDLISAAELYSERISDNCYVDGIDYEVWRCPSIQDIPTNINNSNTDPNIDGIIVFYPIIQFPNENHHKEDPCSTRRRMPGVYYKAYDDNIRGLVHPTKDVEGLCSTTIWFHHRNRNHTSSSTAQQQQQQQRQIVYPCTAMSVKRVLDTYHHNNCNNDNIMSNWHWQNQTVSIINRSEIVGRPLAVMLAELGATVYSIDVNSIIKFHPYNSRRSLVHRHSMIIEDCLSQSTIVVTGVPKEQYKLNLCAIQPSTTLVNVSEYQNVCPSEILERKDINFIPFVGKVTVSILEQNLITLHHENKQKLT